MKRYSAIFAHHFSSTFGEQFGKQLFLETETMCNKDPMQRPKPEDVLSRLTPFL